MRLTDNWRDCYNCLISFNCFIVVFLLYVPRCSVDNPDETQFMNTSRKWKVFINFISTIGLTLGFGTCKVVVTLIQPVTWKLISVGSCAFVLLLLLMKHSEMNLNITAIILCLLCVYGGFIRSHPFVFKGHGPRLSTTASVSTWACVLNLSLPAAWAGDKICLRQPWNLFDTL